MNTNQDIINKAKQWLNPVFDTQTQAKINDLITNNPKELEE